MNKYPQYRLLYDDTALKVIECPPTRRTIRFFKRNGDTTTYNLPFPYTYFRLQKQPTGCKIGFGIGNKELKPVLGDYWGPSNIYFPPLTNVCTNHGVCMGDDPPYNDPIGDFWFSSFYHVDECYRFFEFGEAWPGSMVMNKVFGSLSKWQSKSIDEVLKINWPFYTPFDDFKFGIVFPILSDDVTPLEAFYITKYFPSFNKESDKILLSGKYQEYVNSRK